MHAWRYGRFERLTRSSAARRRASGAAAFAFGLIVAVLTAANATACPLGPEAERKAGYELAYAVDPLPLAVGRHFALEVAICGADRAPYEGDLAVDATMPSHGHGMNYAPKVERRGPGRFRAEGYLLHMPGRWRLEFLLGEAQPVRITSEVQVR